MDVKSESLYNLKKVKWLRGNHIAGYQQNWDLQSGLLTYFKCLFHHSTLFLIFVFKVVSLFLPHSLSLSLFPSFSLSSVIYKSYLKTIYNTWTFSEGKHY